MSKIEKWSDCLGPLTDVIIESVFPPPAYSVKDRGNGEGLDAGQALFSSSQNSGMLSATDAKRRSIMAAI